MIAISVMKELRRDAFPPLCQSIHMPIYIFIHFFGLKFYKQNLPITN